MASDDIETTEDAILGGRLHIRQPKRGHRVGHDAVLLAAATEANAGEHAVDLGAGVGAAGLAVAKRVPGLHVTLVEIDARLAALARENIRINDMADRVRALALDVIGPAQAFDEAGLPAHSAHHVLMNPPFHVAGRERASPDPSRSLAHVGAAEDLGRWITIAARLLTPDGVLTLIWRADGLDRVLAELSGRFGGVAVRPVHPRPDAAAIRVLVRAIIGRRAPLSILPGLVLNDVHGRPTEEAEAVLRNAWELPFVA